MKNLPLSIAMISVFSASAFAELVPLAPTDGFEVPMLSREEQKLFAMPRYSQRLDYLKKNRKTLQKQEKKMFRKAPPFRFKWKATDGEQGPWKVEISENAGFRNAVVYWAENLESEKTDDGKIYRYRVSAPNFKLGQTYYWRVTSNLSCSREGHGELWSLCKCGANLKSGRFDLVSKPAFFKTAFTPPRWIGVEGRVENIRDLGGWKTEDGKRIRQGLVFRGQGLNDNSETGAVKGRNRLYLEDVDYLTKTLGIKTDLDLRSVNETAGMDVSPLGESVNFIHHSSKSYKGVFTEEGKKVMAENVKLFADEKNYPFYFHCIAGADRTGALAFMLLGILGVPEHDALVEWEMTFYPDLPELEKGFCGKNYWKREQHLRNGLKNYGGRDASFKERAELYLVDCGVTKEEIAKIRSILLED